MRNKNFTRVNHFSWNEPHLEVILSRGKTAKIDPSDFQLVKRIRNWHVRPRGRTYYAGSRYNSKYVLMHRLIMEHETNSRGTIVFRGIGPNLVIDHINGDGLDNRRINLRVVTDLENMRNQHFHRSGKKPIRRRNICVRCNGTGLE